MHINMPKKMAFSTMQLHSHECSRNILFRSLSWPLLEGRSILRCKRTSFHEEYAFELSKLQFVSIADIPAFARARSFVIDFAA